MTSQASSSSVNAQTPLRPDIPPSGPTISNTDSITTIQGEDGAVNAGSFDLQLHVILLILTLLVFYALHPRMVLLVLLAFSVWAIDLQQASILSFHHQLYTAREATVQAKTDYEEAMAQNQARHAATTAHNIAKQAELEAYHEARYEELRQELNSTYKLAERITGIPFSTIEKDMHLSRHSPSLLSKYNGGEVAQLRQQYEAQIVDQEAQITGTRRSLLRANRKIRSCKSTVAALQTELWELRQELASQKACHEDALKASKKKAERDEAVIASLENQLERKGEEEDDDPDLRTPPPSVAGDVSSPEINMIDSPPTSPTIAPRQSTPRSRSPSRESGAGRRRSAASPVPGVLSECSNLAASKVLKYGQQGTFDAVLRSGIHVFKRTLHDYIVRGHKNDWLVTDRMIVN
jgi:hypothetical protein